VQVGRRLKGSISSKQYGFEDTLSPLIAEACVDVCPKNPNNFNVDNVRVVKIPGSGLSSSLVVKGMVLKRDVEGTVKHVDDVKIAVYAQGIDTAGTESKGTVLIKNAEELQNYAKTEENKLEEYIKGIASSGAQVVVSGSAIGEMAMHFIEKYGMMAIRIPSKFDLRRFCKATNSTALAKLVSPQAEELGFAKSIKVEEIGGANCTVIRQDASMGSIATIVLRGSTEGQLDDVERAVDDGVNAYKALCKDARVVPGGGASEIEITRRVSDFGKKQTGLDQYAIQKYAEAFEVVTRTLAENSGYNATDALSSLYAAHANGQTNAGLDIETGLPKDLTTEDIADVYLTKWWAIKLATDAVITILKVDQIIMAKQAGGPKPRGPGGDDDE
jgi:T-complex protein 1 subunit theta